MGIPVLSGRTFEARDSNGSSQAAVVNQAFARMYFNGENPIGQFIHEPESGGGIQIIGVVKDSPHLDLAELVEPEIYLNFEQKSLTPFLTGLVVRTRDDPQLLTNTLRFVLSLSSDDQPVVHLETLQNLFAENIWQPRFSASLFSTFAFIALCLSGIGIYGVIAYVTASRRREYGIRLSLGAKPSQLFRLASIQSLVPVIAGVGFGAVGSYWTSQWITSLLYTRPVLST
jgi:ABC-type antimicrobial peptide transport system permease subunit